MISCKTVGLLCDVLASFLKMVTDNKIYIVGFKDRFNDPTDGGWSDLLLNIIRVGDPRFHIMEVQIAYTDLFVVRSQMGAHNEYNEFRAVAEIFEGLGWALTTAEMDRTAAIEASVFASMSLAEIP